MQESNFILNRIKAIKYAAKGFWILITSEYSIIAQVIIAVIVTIIGFIMNISATEWMFQIFAIAIVLVAESLNTAIEKIADFIHPEYHKQIGHIKDISAGAAFFAAIFAVIIGLIIYIPKFI
ncbi:diacylglycerol kinase [Lutibacter sp. B1]|jgi:diacylglycerol kinase (ATP)|uniref:diacylglycerol kinase n=1 Tax=Lutibacter sp. B1 TaxID=2725996 RepID=UPI0014568C8A|nr:diacylglycerol kinase family protein [Lutibacter sp. B1]NLP57975.1 diacylglycerol kinase family protein [Lutibacter sp. B1]